MENLSKKIETITSELRELKQQNILQAKTIENLKYKVEGKVEDKLDANFVGFYAHHGGAASYDSGATMVFDTVMTNQPTNLPPYNPANGIFTCPVTGVYQFSFFLLANGENDIYPQIVVNGIAVAAGHASADGWMESTANSVIINCVQNQLVMVSTYGWSRIDGGRSNSFSGYLLSQEFP